MTFDLSKLRVVVGTSGVGKREDDLRALVQHLHTMKEFSPEMLVIAEQNTKAGKRIVQEFGGTWRFFVQHGLYGACRAVNVGALAAPADGVLMESCADFRFKKDFFITLKRAWEHVYSPTDTMMGPDTAVRQWPDHSRPSELWGPFSTMAADETTYVHLCFRVYSRELFDRVSGLDERHVGAGCADRDFEIRAIRSGCDVVINNALCCTHLEHRTRDDAWHSIETLQRNGILYRECLVAGKDYIRANEGKPWGQFDDEEIHL